MTSSDLSILIVDDNEMNRWLLAEQLQFWSNDIVQAGNGGEAWALLQHNDYDLAFLDVNMPVMDGVELFKKVRQQLHRRAIFIAVTAHAQQQQQRKLLDQGFDDCLIKPVVLADLQRIISQYRGATNKVDVDLYATTLLHKVGYNRQLGEVLLKKLFAETPEQFEEIEQALRQQQTRQAWEIAHKLHGGFCFYGFDDFRPLAERLEQSLLDSDLEDAQFHLLRLQEKFAQVMNSRVEVFARLAE